MWLKRWTTSPKVASLNHWQDGAKKSGNNGSWQPEVCQSPHQIWASKIGRQCVCLRRVNVFSSAESGSIYIIYCICYCFKGRTSIFAYTRAFFPQDKITSRIYVWCTSLGCNPSRMEGFIIHMRTNTDTFCFSHMYQIRRSFFQVSCIVT